MTSLARAVTVCWRHCRQGIEDHCHHTIKRNGGVAMGPPYQPITSLGLMPEGVLEGRGDVPPSPFDN
ncbi:hypothetical protein Syun_029867 [Stephania yunnanensis]|uniref:Uncharacterized protein n=1 Tax=Stephania yunnanensis TaxID=152371 RepID=A0AAP0EDZ9_9MAGN